MRHVLIISVLVASSLTTLSAQEYKISSNADKGLFGVQNRAGNELLPAVYKKIFKCKNSEIHVVTDDGKNNFTLYNTKTEVTLDLWGDYDLLLLYDECALSKLDMIRYLVDGKMGIMYFLGANIFPPKYDEITPVASDVNLYLLKKQKSYQLINTKTGLKTAWFALYDKPYRIFNYDNHFSYLEEPFFAKIDGKLVCITPNGKVWNIEKPKDMPFKVKEYWSDSEPILVKQNGKYGYLGNNGELVIEAQFEEAEQFEKYQAKVTKDGKTFIIDETGTCIEDCD